LPPAPIDATIATRRRAAPPPGRIDLLTKKDFFKRSASGSPGSASRRRSTPAA